MIYSFCILHLFNIRKDARGIFLLFNVYFPVVEKQGVKYFVF